MKETFRDDEEPLFYVVQEPIKSESRTGQRRNDHRARILLTVLTLCIAALTCAIASLALSAYFKVGYQDPFPVLNGDLTEEDNLLLISDQPEQSKSQSGTAQCTSVPATHRHDCWPQATGASQQACENKGCCWLPAYKSSTSVGAEPWCFYPDNSVTYDVQSKTQTSTGYSLTLSLTKPSGWPNDIQNLAVLINYDTPTQLRIKIYDPNNKRFEVPLALNKGDNSFSLASSDYDVDVPSSGSFYVTVTRKSTGKILFSTKGAAPLVFADQFLQLGTQLSSQYVYGLGEHREKFLISTNWTKAVFWARDVPPNRNMNLYGVHPFYLNIEDDAKAHGVFLLNSNAMEVEVQPAPSLTYYTTGGVLDYYIFTGPSSNNVVQQYTDLIGRPFMPPYWSLGFHLCRWGYGGIDGMKAVINRMREAQMPYDVQWNDIDYMRDHLDWTYDSEGKFRGLPDVVNDLHQNGQHYIMIVDPGISNTQPAGSYPPYDDGIKRDIFIKLPNGSAPIIGQVWPGTTAFPDFFHPDATQYWTDHAKAYHDLVPYDGMWIDMNEPSNFYDGSTDGCPDNSLENPPFVPSGLLGGALKARTLCASSLQNISTHYNLHSMYGHSEAVATKKALDSMFGDKRSIVISRSTFPGTGVHSGHWLGDNSAQWDNTYWSISGMLNFQLFGIPLVGADICGFNGDSNPELCARWMQLGAFYPFMRNHNTIQAKDQDPASFDSDTQQIMRDALNLRYSLLPYLYTLFYHSHVDGSTVARPLFFEFPDGMDNYAVYAADTQFMWGSALLITPATSQNTLQGQGYLPKARWYDWFSHVSVDSPGQTVSFDLPREHINLQVRGGSIVPMQQPNVTTTLARKNKFSLLAALAPDATAMGELYWDDGESVDAISGETYNLITFKVQQNTLSSVIVKAGYTAEPMTLGTVAVFGVEVAPTSVVINGQVHTDNYSYKNKVLDIYDLSVNLLQALTISWTV